jgi:hypothetical protein
METFNIKEHKYWKYELKGIASVNDNVLTAKNNGPPNDLKRGSTVQASTAWNF